MICVDCGQPVIWSNGKWWHANAAHAVRAGGQVPDSPLYELIVEELRSGMYSGLRPEMLAARITAGVVDLFVRTTLDHFVGPDHVPTEPQSEPDEWSDADDAALRELGQ